MTDVLRIAHPQNCPPYGNSRVGICEGNLMMMVIRMVMVTTMMMVTTMVAIRLAQWP